MRFARAPHLTLIAACAGSLACANADNTIARDDKARVEALVPRFEISGTDSTRRGFTKPIVRQLHDGRIIVADQSEVMLAEFDTAGAFVRSHALRGSGPGEINAPFSVSIHRDTVVMIGTAPGALQVSWLDLTTGAKGSLSPPRRDAASNVTPRYTVIDRFPSGSWLVKEGAAFRIMNQMPPVGTLLPDSITLGVLTHSEMLTDASVTWLPRMAQTTSIAYPWVASPLPSSLAPHPLRLGVLFQPAGNALWTLDATTGRGQRWRPVAQPMRFSIERQSPSTVDAAALNNMLARALPEARRALDSSKLAAIFDPANAPDSAPYASSLVQVYDGTIWVEAFQLDSSAAHTYIALDSMGATRGVYRTPAGVRVQFVGPTLVLGTWRDPDGLQFVRAFPLPSLR